MFSLLSSDDHCRFPVSPSSFFVELFLPLPSSFFESPLLGTGGLLFSQGPSPLFATWRRLLCGARNTMASATRILGSSTLFSTRKLNSLACTCLQMVRQDAPPSLLSPPSLLVFAWPLVQSCSSMFQCAVLSGSVPPVTLSPHRQHHDLDHPPLFGVSEQVQFDCGAQGTNP